MTNRIVDFILNFNSRGAWGSSTYTWTHDEFASWISIPVVRGGVQHCGDCAVYGNAISIPVVRGGVQLDTIQWVACSSIFQFPWCVGEFNEASYGEQSEHPYFNSRGAWGSSTASIYIT